MDAMPYGVTYSRLQNELRRLIEAICDEGSDEPCRICGCVCDSLLDHAENCAVAHARQVLHKSIQEVAAGVP